jgi:hypothetical protein
MIDITVRWVVRKTGSFRGGFFYGVNSDLEDLFISIAASGNLTSGVGKAEH